MYTMLNTVNRKKLSVFWTKTSQLKYCWNSPVRSRSATACETRTQWQRSLKVILVNKTRPQSIYIALHVFICLCMCTCSTHMNLSYSICFVILLTCSNNMYIYTCIEDINIYLMYYKIQEKLL